MPRRDKNTIYYREVSFIDGEGKSTRVEVGITNRNGYPEFTAAGEHCGSHGQCDEHIVGRTESQDQLLEIWDLFHLNGMNNPLPPGFQQALDSVLDDIEEEEKERAETLAEELGITVWSDIDDEKIIALGMHLELTPAEASEDIEQSGWHDCSYSYSGEAYLVCDDDEADELAKEEAIRVLEECYFHNVPDNLQDYIDKERYADDVVSCDGRGSVLNHYDGEEYEASVNDTWYYIYKE